MQKLSYDLAQPIGHRATLGVIALQTDETIEPEIAEIIPRDGIATYVTRIPSDAEVTPETLREMEAALPQAAGLLPTSVKLDVVGYGCTSGATLIGPDRVANIVKSATGAKHVTNPITAVIAACRTQNIQRLGFITPYVPEVSAPMRDMLENQGITITRFASFEEPEEAKVARISPTSIKRAAIDMAQKGAQDAIFISCTNLHALPIIAETEDVIGRPIISSNQALAWHMMRLANITDQPKNAGSIFTA